MKILLTVGHSVLKNGCYTSADGRPYGGVLEYDYCKKLAPHVKQYLEQAEHKVTLVICPERQFTKSRQERSHKIGIENAGDFDLVIELHLNASAKRTAKGSSVYYYSTSKTGKAYAERVVAKLGQFFENDGAIARSNLYMLSQTKAPTILIETFFCDNAEECKKATTVGMDAIGRAIAEGVANKSLVSVKAQQTKAQTKAKEKCSVTKELPLSFPVVSKGCTGVAVRMLQTMIGTPVTGTWNDADVKAWKVYQKNTGQTQDGICGKDGWTSVAEHLKANTYK